MDESRWVDALAAEDLPVDDVLGVVVAGRAVAIHAIGDALYATDDVCTHGQAQLCMGFLDGYEIECPLHQGRFDVRDGRPTCEPATVPLRTYPVRVQGTRVELQLDD